MNFSSSVPDMALYTQNPDPIANMPPKTGQCSELLPCCFLDGPSTQPLHSCPKLYWKTAEQPFCETILLHPQKDLDSELDHSPRSRLQCYDHGCGGRGFSSAENLRRHIREREAKNRVFCDYCQTSFSRRSNRDQHVWYGRCKVIYKENNDLTQTVKGWTIMVEREKLLGILNTC